MLNMRTPAVLCILTILAVSATAFGQSWTVTQLTNNSGDDYDPQVSGNNVVWTGPNGSGYTNVFKYNGTSVTQLSTGDANDTHARVSGDNVVWQRGGGGIHLHNGTTAIQVADYGQDPDVSGNKVAFVGGDTATGINGLWLYDGSTVEWLWKVGAITWRSATAPKISGDRIVWELEGVMMQGYTEVHYYDGSTDASLTSTCPFEGESQISGNKTVWANNVFAPELPEETEIRLYDGTTTTQLTDNDVVDRSPQISGSNVVWQQWDGSDWEIVFYDGNSNTQLTSNAYDDTNPHIDGPLTVWQGSDGNDTEIFVYDGTSIIQITNNSTDDELPRVSGSTITWRGHDGNDWEIFTARQTSPECWTGDLNGDLIIDITDLNMVLIDWSKSGAAITDSRSDTNSDGTVDITDLNNVLIDWGKTGYKL